MNVNAYKVIFLLLSLCVLSVLGLQAFWLNSFYLQKKELFNGSVYSALEQVGIKLKDRGTLREVKEKIFISREQPPARKKAGRRPERSGNLAAMSKNRTADPGLPTLTGRDSTLPPVSDTMIVVTSQTSHEYRVESALIENNLNRTNHRVRVLAGKPAPAIHILNPDSAQMLLRSRMSRLAVDSLLRAETRQVIKKKEIQKLMDKMFMEIKVIEQEEKNADTLKNIIARAFENRGLFLPFEFALKKENGERKETIARSENFDDKLTSFSSDLSANNVFRTHNYLYVQFPGAGNYMLSSMKGTLLLSLVFSLLIIFIFYYTARLIMRQKKLSDIKNDFVNNMTHELKTPIATISLAIDAMKNPQIKNSEERFNNYSRILKEENEKLNRHVERVLQMSMIGKGQLQLNKVKLNLVGTLRDTIKNYALQCGEKSAEVIFHPKKDEVMVYADPEHMSAVFSNLMDNALKYSKEDCRIEISLADRNEEVEVHFNDNGIGIHSRQKDKIFEKFYRVQGGNLHDVKGFGLGLSYVKSIIEAHGGAIDLESEKGKGTTFMIRLKKYA